MERKVPDPSLSLLTDLYQITMAYGYWKAGKAEQRAVFNLYFRKHPFSGGFTVACGLGSAIRYLNDYGLSDSDVDYLRGLTGNDGRPLFEESFLNYLRDLEFRCDVDALPEGTLAFPNEPLLRVRGPILQGQLLETPLLNLINFETLIATKAARMRVAAPDDTLFEFGLRRAQGPDGGLTASRAAYVGGFDGTSNVLAGKRFGIPVKGTHAHSWVMSFDSEREAFETYARHLPNNVILLVDTYDTLAGVREAIRVGHRLRERGHELGGIRLDSGDLAYLSIEARRLLDEAGFERAAIVASNDLDEYIITSLKNQKARINVWGVGTKLVTAYDQPALGGVYKLAALENENGVWENKVKLSEQTLKTSTPGIQQVRRFAKGGTFAGDMIYTEGTSLDGEVTIIDPLDFTKQRSFDDSYAHEDLLVPVFRLGKQRYKVPSLEAVRRRVADQLAGLHAGTKRLTNPHTYPVGLEQSLFRTKTELILKLRGQG